MANDLLEKKLNNFKKLSKEEQYKKVLSMLEILKWDGDLFDDLYSLVLALENDISSELLYSIYSTIETALLNLDKEALKEDLQKIDKIRNKLKKLKEVEQKEREDENPDDLLNNL